MPSVSRRAAPGSLSARRRAPLPRRRRPGRPDRRRARSRRPAAAQPSGPGVAPLPPVANKLPRATPESQGVSSQALLAFIEALDANVDTMNSIIVVRHGQVIAEGWWAPFAADTPHQLFSLTKSFTSTAVGLAQAEGKLSIDDPVLKYFPDVTPAAGNDFQKGMRIRDLLAMSTGHRTEPSFQGSTTWTKTFFEHPVLHKPGTIFLYNTPASYMLSAIVQKATGQKEADYLQSRLFTPLGIGTPRWETSPEGVSIGGYGLWLRTEDIARFGQLYLQKGQWQGKQLVPADWVAAATTRQTSNGSSPTSDWDQGYGYQFWRSRNKSFRGDGAHGQFCMVLPDQDTVVAMTSGTRNMQGVMNVVWEKLLPALGAAKLPENLAAKQALTDRARQADGQADQRDAAPGLGRGDLRQAVQGRDQRSGPRGADDGPRRRRRQHASS